jgi:hypothetical protein
MTGKMKSAAIAVLLALAVLAAAGGTMVAGDLKGGTQIQWER